MGRGRGGINLTTRGLSAEEYRGAWSDWLVKVFGGASTSGSDSSSTSLVTLTFAPRPWELSGCPGISRVQRAGRKFARRLTRALESPSFFIVLERGSWNGRMHLHSLISCRDVAPIRGAMRLHEETEGFSHRVVTSLTPAEYVTKYVSKSDGDFWLAGGPLFRTDKLGSVDPAAVPVRNFGVVLPGGDV